MWRVWRGVNVGEVRCDGVADNKVIRGLQVWTGCGGVVNVGE